MWLTYDLESTFLRRGFKRPDTLILEIALFGKTVPEKSRPASFQRLVNPFPSTVQNGEDLLDALYQAGQHGERTINFWTKLLVEKKLLNTTVRRYDLHKKADAIVDVLTTSKDAFVSPKEALDGALEFGRGHYWVAHNGKSFDEKIIRGTCARENITVEDVTFADSLPIFRTYKPDEASYSQPILFKSMFPQQRYMAHHAEEDARALHKMMTAVMKEHESVSALDILRCGHVSPTTSKKKRQPSKKVLASDLNDIRFVGPKSIAVFQKKGIHSKKDLHAYISTHTLDEWLSTFTKVYRHKILGDRLYKGEITLVTSPKEPPTEDMGDVSSESIVKEVVV